MRIGICDDDLDFTADICTLLARVEPTASVITFSSGFVLLEHIAKRTLDVLILDMEMPNLNGLETGRELRQLHPGLTVIIATSYPEKYALACYALFPLTLLIKPVAEDTMQECLRRARERSNRDVLKIQTRDFVKYVPLYEIYSLENSVNRLTITLEGLETHRIYQTLSYYEAQLSDKGFFRISRGVLINLRHVREVHEFTIRMTNGAQLVLSRRRKDGLMGELIRWRRTYE